MMLGTLLLICSMSWQADVALTVDANGFLGVVTHKAGALKGLAHNHLITAEKFEAKLSWDGNRVSSLRGEIRLRVGNLSADDPIKATRWFPKIESLGWLNEPYGLVPVKDRKKIRKAMLGKKQLDQLKFPEIRAQIQGISDTETTVGQVVFSHVLSVAMTIKDKTVVLKIPATLTSVDGALQIEAGVTSSFSAFGIEPYSALLGAISNQDRFDLLISLTAR